MLLFLLRRVGSCADTEMEEAIEDGRPRRGSASFDKTCVTELRVKQKYMGHRNARYIIISLIVITLIWWSPTINAIYAYQMTKRCEGRIYDGVYN